MAKATIWHNPNCGTSRKALERLTDAGFDVTVIRYLDQPYARDQLAQMFAAAGISARDALRTRGNDAQERGLTVADDVAILDAMAANSAYVERPFVETAKGVRLCRPIDKIDEII